MPNRPLPKNVRLTRFSAQTPRRPKEPEVSLEPPTWLSSEAAEVWREVLPLMVADGTWRPLFVNHAATYCELAATFRQGPNALDATKLAQLRLLAGDLGLSPSHYPTVARTLR